MANNLERIVAGALRAAIHDHGPITLDQVGSATRRVVGQLGGAVGPAARGAAGGRAWPRRNAAR